MIDLKKILYCPLDLPPLPKELTLSKLENLWDYLPPSDPKIISTLNAQNGGLAKTAWKVLELRTKTPNNPNVRTDWFAQTQPGDWVWTDKSQLHAPILLKWLEEHLPFKDIYACWIISSVGPIKSHSDIPPDASKELINHCRKNDPAFYRFVIDGTLIENGFYVFNDLTPKTYTKLPKDSPGWVMGATSCLHGNDDKVSNHKVLCYAMGEIDTDRHYNLVERSYLKYKDFAVVTQQVSIEGIK